MKKVLLLIFSFFLSLIHVHAGIYLPEITDALSLKSGTRIVIGDGSNSERKKYLWSAGDSLYWLDNPSSIHSDASFILEAVGDSVNGYPNYYLKSENNGKYVSFLYVPDGPDASISEDYPGQWEVFCKLIYTSEKKDAAPFVIAPSEEAKHWGYYDCPIEAEENTFMLLTPFHEFQNKTIYLSINYVMSANPGVGIYSDYATWMKIYELESKPSAYDDLLFLCMQVEDLNYAGGNNTGQYDPLLVADYNKYREEAMNFVYWVGGSEEEAKRIYKDLKAAWDALETAGPNPLTAGYYRIFSAYPAFKEHQGTDKVIYATPEGEIRWKNLDRNDPTMGWEICQNADGNWQMKNLGTGQFVSGVGVSSLYGSPIYITSFDSIGHFVHFDVIGNGGFNISYKGEAAMHAGGHGEGAGVAGEIVGWSENGLSPSAWYLYPLSKDTAEVFVNVGAFERKKMELSQLQEKAKEKYRQGWNTEIDMLPENWLVTLDDYNADKMVVFSNADHNSWNPNSKDGVGYIGLLDDDQNSFWHSAWGLGPKEEHFLQFKLNRSVRQFAVYLNRRKNQLNNPTQLDFYVSKDTTDANGWIKAGSITGLPAFVGTDESELSYQSEPILLSNDYQFVRVYWKSAQGFTHFAGFHFQNVNLSSNSLNFREDIKIAAENLSDALAETDIVLQNSLATDEELTAAYEKLMDAYKAYEQVFPDLNKVKDYLEEVKAYYEMSVSEESHADITKIYPDPGTYKEADRQQMKTDIQAVEKAIQEFEQTMSYTNEDVELLLQNLKDIYQIFKEKQRWIVAADAENSGVWYHIAASQRYYDITGANQDEGNDGNSVRRGMIYVKSFDGMMNQASLFVGTAEEMAANDVTDMDYASWRFINVGDTAYAIQNKATGLFVSFARNNRSKALLTINPVLFKIDEIGYGSFVFDGYDMRGAETNALYTDPYQNVGYHDGYELGSGSCWDIYTTDRTENGVAVGDYQFPEIDYEIAYAGKLTSYAFPVGIEAFSDNRSLGESIYEVVQSNDMGIVLSPKERESLKPGEPFYYMPAGKNDEVKKEESVVLRVKVASDVAIAPEDTVNGLVACYLPVQVPENAYTLTNFMPVVLAQYYSGKVCDKENFTYLLPDEIIAVESDREKFFLPYSDADTEYLDSLLLILDQYKVYLPYLGERAGQYADTVKFADTYANALKGWPAATAEQCKVLLDSLVEAKNALRMNMPKPDGVYRLKNQVGQYIAYDVDNQVPFLLDNALTDASAFYYGDDKHLTACFKHLQLQNHQFALESTGLPYEFKEVHNVLGAVQIELTDASFLASGQGSIYVSLEEDNKDTYWFIEDVSDVLAPTFELELHEYEGEGYATLYLPVAVKLAEGMKAYVGSVDGEYLKMSALDGDIVPPAVPVVIKGVPGVYQLPYDATAQKTIQLQNDLYGLLAARVVTEDVNPYTLQIVENQLGFFKYSGFLLNAFKAYLNLPKGMQIRGMIWDDSEVTGILDSILDENNAEVYDLSGRRVKDIKRPGIYIVNGKKVVIK